VYQCIKEVVVNGYGEPAWNTILKKADIEENKKILMFDDVPKEQILSIISAIIDTTGLSIDDVAEQFGLHWVNVVSNRAYGRFYKNESSARDLILNLNAIHQQVIEKMTQSIEMVSFEGVHELKKPQPPVFEFEWEDQNRLIVTYLSHRGLVDIFIGCVKGVGVYYNEDLKTYKISDSKVMIDFSESDNNSLIKKILGFFKLKSV